MRKSMSAIKIKMPEGAKKLSPLEMNKLAILKAHTVITFSDRGKSSESDR